MNLSELDHRRVQALRRKDPAPLQELYLEAYPRIEAVVGEANLAKRYLQDALLKLRDDIVAGRLMLESRNTLAEYLIHLCAQRFDREKKDKDVEKRILDALKNSDQDGWAFYYMQMHYFPGVKFFVQKNGGSEDEAKDVIMDGIEALIRNVRDGSYTPQSNAKLKTYFFQICRNKWFDYLGKKKRTRPMSLFADLELDDFEANYYYEFDDDMLNERVRVVAQLFDQSTETCRQVLSYFYYDEMPHDIIAERMGFANAESSKTQKTKCLRKLKTAVQNIFKSEPLSEVL